MIGEDVESGRLPDRREWLTSWSRMFVIATRKIIFNFRLEILEKQIPLKRKLQRDFLFLKI